MIAIKIKYKILSDNTAASFNFRRMKLIVYVLSEGHRIEIKKMNYRHLRYAFKPFSIYKYDTLTRKKRINETVIEVRDIVSIKISSNERDGIFRYTL